MTPGSHPNSYALLYDGSCGLCRQLMRFIHWLGPRVSMRYVDASEPQNLRVFPQIPAAQAMRSVHLVTQDGHVERGYDAVVALCRLLPLFHWLAPMMGWRLSRRVGWALYEWVAEHRHQIGHLLRLE